MRRLLTDLEEWCEDHWDTIIGTVAMILFVLLS